MATPLTPPDLAKVQALVLQEIELLITTVWELFAYGVNPFASKASGAEAFKHASRIPLLVQAILEGAMAVAVGNFDNTHNLLYTLLTTVLGPLGTTIADDYSALLKGFFDTYDADIQAAATVDPTMVDKVVTAALEQASILGVGSRAITAFFELFIPKQLNVFNWIGPTLAQLSGYDEIIAQWRTPLIDASIGNLARYNANQQFLTEAPAGELAERWFAQGLITAAQRDQVVAWSGRMAAYQAASQAGAYRPLQPRALATLFQDIGFDPNQMTDLLTFAAMRPQDQAVIQPALVLASTKNVRQEYLSAAVRSTELGTMTAQDLAQVLTDISYSQDAANWVQLTVATRKLEQLAELYRKSISEGYKYGTVTDANYVASLEAIGIGEADAEAHYAVDSIVKQGKALAAEERAANQLAAKRTRGATQAAIAEYRTGSLNSAELEATLIAAGLDPLVATYAVAAQVAKQSGPMVYVYGVELPRAQALVLREKVGAIGVQVKAQLITPAAALLELAALDVPPANANALVAEWAATKTPAADVGVLLPP
jgi:hypothetical protein